MRVMMRLGHALQFPAAAYAALPVIDGITVLIPARKGRSLHSCILTRTGMRCTTLTQLPWHFQPEARRTVFAAALTLAIWPSHLQPG